MFYLGFDDVLAEAVSSIEHVQFAKNLARSHVVRQRLDRHRATHHSVQHQLKLGNVLVLNTDNLYHPTHLNSLSNSTVNKVNNAAGWEVACTHTALHVQ